MGLLLDPSLKMHSARYDKDVSFVQLDMRVFIYLFIKSWVSALPRRFLFGHAHSRTDLLKLDLLLTGSLWAVSTTRRGTNTSLQNVTLDPRIFST